MQRFTELYITLDRTNRTAEKVAALEDYFSVAEPADAAWALFFLMGNTVQRTVATPRLRDWLAEAADLPLWLVEESYDAVGDLAEALALLLPPHGHRSEQPLHQFVEEKLVPLRSLAADQQRRIVQRTWQELSPEQALVWHKLLMGQFRVGVAKTLVIRALANVADIPPATMAHRLMGAWQPNVESYKALMGEAPAEDPGRPYPFYLAHPLENAPEELGDINEWQIEWKWDGIRSQAVRRGSELLVWSRGEELVTDRFPELASLAALPPGTVLDGEILAWHADKPLPFAALQTRIGRKRMTPKVLQTSPVVFMAYDVLEHEGRDIRPLPLNERRGILEMLVAATQPRAPQLRLSPLVEPVSWDELKRQYQQSREFGVEGVMLKRRSSAYGVGRVRGDWWKWKILPYTIDAVLIYAQLGNGKRASLYTDYTFGLWENGELVPMAKAYSGLTDDEIRQVDAFVRRNTVERFGPVRVVKPELVFELHFEAIQASSRHKSGIAVRFPRMGRWRHDKRPDEADTMEALRRLLPKKVEQPEPVLPLFAGLDDDGS